MKRIVIIAILILALGVVFARAKAPKKAPACTFYDLGDQEVRLSTYKGTPVILFFWASWCPYCRQEITNLNSTYPEIVEAGIQVFGVNVNEPRETVINIINSNHIEFDMLQDKGGGCTSSFGIVGIPTYILIDKEGKIVIKANSLPVNYKELLLK